MDSIGIPKWLRMVVVGGVIMVLAGSAALAYRWYYRPTTLTIAVGSLDGEAGRIIAAIAARLVSMKAPVRLNITDTPSALDAANAFASGKVDLAVVRADVGDLSQAQAVIVLAHAVALLVAPPGSSATKISDLKLSVVGVIGGETNRELVRVLTDEYDLGRAGITFQDIAPPDARRALESRRVRAMLIVLPLVEKYLSLVRGLFNQNAKTAPVLIPIESAGAIAQKERAYESFDVPKGTLRAPRLSLVMI
jgi:TRAP-type uncharacterized transport system substrate-binding protein